ncbi:hypothetical protein Taro_028116, partial [Colocasia esculenta]|nr:hypothetical protein [Colocasia esculenta]
MAASTDFGGRTNVRVVVVGDEGTGKSSLIVSAATESFPDNVPALVPPTRLPPDYYPDRVPVTIIDTSSRSSRCRRKFAIFFAIILGASLSDVRVPVIVVGCKLDQRDEQQLSLEQVVSPIMQQFREIETCIECSALKQIQVPEVFYYAQKAVLHPTAPLFDQETQSLKPRCIRALKRIFILCDHDRDGALSDSELNDFQ